MDRSDGLLLWSTLLEISGLAAAAWGIADNRVRYGGGEPLRALIARQVRRIFGIKSSKHYHMKAGTGNVAILGDRAEVTVRPGPNTPLERRMELLEERMDAQAKRSREIEKRLRERLDKIEADSGRAREEIRQRVETLEGRVGDLVTEGASLEAIGLWWIGLGVVSQSVAALLFS